MDNLNQSFSSNYCQVSILVPEDNDTKTKSAKKHDIIVKGVLNDSVIDNELRYIAAGPADRRASFAGSGLPFHSEKQAFDNTPNRGVVQLNGKSFEIPLLFPNAYYIEVGNKLVPPSLYLHYTDARGDDRTITIKLGDAIPYRLIDYPCQQHPTANFYHAHHHNLPVRSQEQVLRDSRYPSANKTAEDFWGLKPSL